MSCDFTGRTVVVTGAGANLGLAVARGFLDAGAQVAICNRTRATLDEGLATIPAEQRPRLLARRCDVSRPRQVAAFFAACDRRFGPPDILVTNAAHLGVGEPERCEDIDLAFFDQVVAVNLRGTFLCMREAARRMRRRGGAIVNIGTNTVARGIRRRAAYIASKGGGEALARALALDLAPRIRVNTVVPGYILTGRWDRITPAARRRRNANVPLGRASTAAEVAAAVLFLAGPDAANITGARLVVDGGCENQLCPRDCQL